MKIEQGCTIIKTKELKDLYKEIEDLKESHRTEVRELKNTINELEQSKKPDEIRIKLFIYKEGNSYHWSSDNFFQWSTEIHEKIDLSMGLLRQIRRILDTFKYSYDKLYKEKYDKEVKKVYEQNIKNVNYSLETLCKKFKNQFYWRSDIISLILQEKIKT